MHLPLNLCVPFRLPYPRPHDEDDDDDDDDDSKDDDDDDDDDELKASMSDAIIRSSPAALPHRAEQREEAQPLTFPQTNKKESLSLSRQSLSLYQTPQTPPLENEKKCLSQRLLLVAKIIQKLRKFLQNPETCYFFCELFLLLTFLLMASWRGCVKTPVDQREVCSLRQKLAKKEIKKFYFLSNREKLFSLFNNFSVLRPL